MTNLMGNLNARVEMDITEHESIIAQGELGEIRAKKSNK